MRVESLFVFVNFEDDATVYMNLWKVAKTIVTRLFLLIYKRTLTLLVFFFTSFSTERIPKKRQSTLL